MAYFNGKKILFSPRFNIIEGGGSDEIEEVTALPATGEIGKVYKVSDTGELYAFLSASVFDWNETVETYANEQQAYSVIGELMGYDTCHILFTAVNSFGEEFSCIIYTNSYTDPYTGCISSMQGSGDYGNGYGNDLGGAYELLNGDITFSRLMYNAELSYYDAGTVTITNVTPLGQKLFDFSTGGKVNITTGKVE